MSTTCSASRNANARFFAVSDRTRVVEHAASKDAAASLTHLSDDALEEVLQQSKAERLRLTGTAEDQYREWRKMLKQLYLEETGSAAAPPPAPPAATATNSGASPSG